MGRAIRTKKKIITLPPQYNIEQQLKPIAEESQEAVIKILQSYFQNYRVECGNVIQQQRQQRKNNRFQKFKEKIRNKTKKFTKEQPKKQKEQIEQVEEQPEQPEQTEQKEEAEQDTKQAFSKPKMINGVYIGVNTCTRLLKRKECDVLVVCKDASPTYLITHLIPLSILSNTPICVLFNKSGALGRAIGLKSCLAMGFKKNNETETIIEKLISKSILPSIDYIPSQSSPLPLPSQKQQQQQQQQPSEETKKQSNKFDKSIEIPKKIKLKSKPPPTPSPSAIASSSSASSSKK